MRKEPYDVGSIVHVLKRGARGLPITKDAADQMRFARLLYHLNDEHTSAFWEEMTYRLPPFQRPASWPERRALVKIHAWVLMPNHFHLILEEIQDAGISQFMKKISVSMTMHFNLKYGEKGSIFQGPYKSRTVGTDRYFTYLAPYVMVKNVFELYPGGFAKASKEFERAWKWASGEYWFSSLPDYVGKSRFPIIDRHALTMFDSPAHFKTLAKDMILGRVGDVIQTLGFEEETEGKKRQ